jgi:hypothetical protein
MCLLIMLKLLSYRDRLVNVIGDMAGVLPLKKAEKETK